MALEAVGFMKDDPSGRGGLCVLLVLDEGVRFKLPVVLLPEVRVLIEAFCVDLAVLVFVLLGFSGNLLTVLVEVALFRELLELTMLFLEFDRCTPFLLPPTLLCESVFLKLPDLRGITLFLDISCVVCLKALARSKFLRYFGDVVLFGDGFADLVTWGLAVERDSLFVELVPLLSRDEVLIGFGFAKSVMI